MRDIAKECNVSVATVSYVLNHSENEKISHDTCLKVMEAATRLHYTPSTLAKCSVGHKSNLVGIIINLKDHNTSGKKLIYYDLAAELSNCVKLLGFESIIITNKDLQKDFNIIAKHSLDAVFMIDVDNNIIGKITKNYFVPIIFLDCEVDGYLFCKIYPNYPALFQKAKAILHTDEPFLVMEDIYSQNLKDQIIKEFPAKDIFINVPNSDLHLFLQTHSKRKGIILGDILALQVELFMDNQDFVVVSSLGNTHMLLPGTQTVFIRNKSIAATAAETLQKMLCLDYKADEGNRILLECELQ
jgi:hypothetical protein